MAISDATLKAALRGKFTSLQARNKDDDEDDDYDDDDDDEDDDDDHEEEDSTVTDAQRQLSY